MSPSRNSKHSGRVLRPVELALDRADAIGAHRFVEVERADLLDRLGDGSWRAGLEADRAAHARHHAVEGLEGLVREDERFSKRRVVKELLASVCSVNSLARRRNDSRNRPRHRATEADRPHSGPVKRILSREARVEASSRSMRSDSPPPAMSSSELRGPRRPRCLRRKPAQARTRSSASPHYSSPVIGRTPHAAGPRVCFRKISPALRVLGCCPPG